jgi:hypothetical protein
VKRWPMTTPKSVDARANGIIGAMSSRRMRASAQDFKIG